MATPTVTRTPTPTPAPTRAQARPEGPAPAPIPAPIPSTMTAAVARRFGTPEVAAIEEVPVPTPGKGEMLVEVAASSLNALDWHFLTGTPYFIRIVAGFRRPRRLIHGADVAGTVVATGPGVTRFRPGDEVFGEARGGGFGAYATVKETAVAAKPARVSFEAAGATPVAGLTALQALRTHARVEPGDRVLINGAAGGVGTFAVQIAVALGAEVTAVCSTTNVDMVRALGPAEVIDYRQADFVDGGARFDVMVDNVGNRTPAECLSVLAPEARYVAVSGPKGRWVGPLVHLARMALALRRSSATLHQFTASPDHDDLTFLGELLADGRITPQIQRVIGLDRVAEGLVEIGTGHTRAKIVVVP